MPKSSHKFNIDDKEFILSAEYQYYDNTSLFLDAEKAAIETRLILNRYKDPLVDVSWSLFYGQNYPSVLSVRDRNKMLLEFRSIIKQLLKTGFGGRSPEPGIIVVAYPWGSKVDMGPTSLSHKIGRKRRIAFAKSCADFSDPTSDGWMLARYNDNLDLVKIPLNEY